MKKLLFLSLAFLAGCESFSYYSQAVCGQLGLMNAARPVESWLADPATPPELRGRLQTARSIREFATLQLALPANGSFSSYAELDRPYPVWNVYAAPRFAVEPKKECFPFTGCVAYRGFFAEDEARRYAAKLRGEGYDVFVGGVPAYSTLGWFDDPLLSSFITFPDVQLARLMFHELAHQRVYLKGDTTFNESFAVTVEEEGVRRWLEAAGRGSELETLRAARQRRQQFAVRVAQTRGNLAALYRENLPEAEMLARKQAEYAKLRADYPGIPADASNAYLASIAVYTELVPQFQALLGSCGGDLKEFYERAAALAESKRDVRAALTSAGCRQTS